MLPMVGEGVGLGEEEQEVEGVVAEVEVVEEGVVEILVT